MHPAEHPTPVERAAAAGLLVAAPAWVLAEMVRWSSRVRRLAPPHPEQAPPRPWAIVLGARTLPDGRPGPGLVARLEAALRLARAGVTERILVTGTDEGPTGGEVTAMVRYLEAEGVAPRRVRADPLGVRTRASLERARSVFGIRSAFLCTQPFHLPRALYLASRVGIDAVPVAAHPSPQGGRSRRTVRASRVLRDRAREVAAWSLAIAEMSLSTYS